MAALAAAFRKAALPCAWALAGDFGGGMAVDRLQWLGKAAKDFDLSSTCQIEAQKRLRQQGKLSPRAAQHSTHASGLCAPCALCTAKIGVTAARTTPPLPSAARSQPIARRPALNRAGSSP